ncbi:protein of unknown function DUF534 [Coriobacterium glomerans PW2]|uniref:ABC transporter substrate binding protein n=1 Tax=Coriobacterium glomerans (strain ATCC 49209 / DSM 20642 / JCM 10262 / PW2) TaxID=700015 RepID=F2N8T6_CORGP|nr:ABC transporter substrate-binding protein [Coriobacterium glomerans]AEB07469.1 protein of unknown function DUF534 [Coriobacterium glomerans PW2]
MRRHISAGGRICAAAYIAAVTLIIAIALSACGIASETDFSRGDAAHARFRIGVLQFTEHSAMDQASAGFVSALDDAGISYRIDHQSAQGDQSGCQTICEKLVNDEDDLIFALGTQAAQSAASATPDIPIVGSAITDYAEAGLVESNDSPNTNVTGTSDLTPVADQIELLHTLLPDAKTVGLLYCSGESNSAEQIKMAEEACDKRGLSTKRYTVSSSNEIQQVVESMAGEVDAIYTPTDNTIAAGMSTVSMVATERHLPVIVGSDTMVEDGGLASFSIDYHDLGYKAGQMAVKILTGGADPQDMAIEHLTAEECRLVINKQAARELGVDLSRLKEREYTML